jgi:putative ABC transport system substrate-binding protein
MARFTSKTAKLTLGLIVPLVLGLFAASLAVEAQQAEKVWRVGLLHIGLDHVPPSLPALREALKELGYVEGQNIHLDFRNQPDEAAALETATEFSRTPVDLIIAFEDQTIRAAKAANSDVPVLFLHANAPVIDEFVQSFDRPRGNMTGFVGWPVSYGKQLELFKELIPGLSSLLLLSHPEDPVGRRWLEEARRAGDAQKIRLIERQATNQAEIERIIRTAKVEEVGGILMPSQILRNSYSSLVIQLASERRLPLGMHRKAWVERGALFSYSADMASVGRAAAPYVDKILQGTKSADLPVDRVSQFEFVINLKTAKELGLTIPPRVLFQATTVIR